MYTVYYRHINKKTSGTIEVVSFEEAMKQGIGLLSAARDVSILSGPEDDRKEIVRFRDIK